MQGVLVDHLDERGAQRPAVIRMVLGDSLRIVLIGVVAGVPLARVVIGGLRMREAYAALDGPLLVLVACLIPVSDAIQTTGGADLIGSGLAFLFAGAPGLVAIAGCMAAAMAVTPFLNNAATVVDIVRAINVCFSRDFPRLRTVMINSDGGSTDDTPCTRHYVGAARRA